MEIKDWLKFKKEIENDISQYVSSKLAEVEEKTGFSAYEINIDLIETTLLGQEYSSAVGKTTIYFKI